MAAYCADAKTMAELSLLDLTGHHPDARENSGYTAEEAFDLYEDHELWRWVGLDPLARNERRKAWEALVKKAREQNKDWRIEELDSTDDEWTNDSGALSDDDELDGPEEGTYPMPGSFDTV